MDLLAHAEDWPNSPPKALIAPHAGYAYSGQVAATAFATLQDGRETVSRVVLVGPAHYVYLRGVATPAADVFGTPLGPVPIDVETLDKIADLPFVRRSDRPHAPEHALEVELPFLQSVLANFQLVPLVIGDAAPQDIANLLRELWGGPETLIVVSSDLSHYHEYETARRLDLATATAIEHGEWQKVGPNQACGCLAITGLLIEAARHGLKACRLS